VFAAESGEDLEGSGFVASGKEIPAMFKISVSSLRTTCSDISNNAMATRTKGDAHNNLREEGFIFIFLFVKPITNHSSDGILFETKQVLTKELPILQIGDHEIYMLIPYSFRKRGFFVTGAHRTHNTLLSLSRVFLC
jgi:hypothetical protein